MIKAGIVGVSGYGGIELFHILESHPDVEIKAISSQTYNGMKLSEVFPHLYDVPFICKNYSPLELAEICDVIFTSVPHGGPAMDFAIPIKNAGKKLIDLSADFRLKDVNVYKEWYKVDHKYPELLKDAVYGLPELHRDEIKKAWLIANPGCYTTSAILAISPVINEDFIDQKSIIIDSKSGISGAGRKPKPHLHFPELEESFQAYSPAEHRHTSEIEQEISILGKKDITVTFVPNLVPMIRGILSTTYITLKSGINVKKVVEIFKKFYNAHPFVRILEEKLPNTKFVTGTNYIDIAVRIDERNGRLIIISALDNLIKGASGQAVQNMNLAFGLAEDRGLKFKPIYP